MPGQDPDIYTFRLKDKTLDLRSGPQLMGILNVTPDSFSDGALYDEPSAATERALSMIEAGAHLIDIGGESTRPGAEPVSDGEEIRRVVPVIERIRRSRPDMPLSIDTRSAGVAEAALGAGADAVNDVSALRHDQRMIEVVLGHDAGVFLMHMEGTPGDMQRDPQYEDVVGEVRDFLRERAEFAVAAGIAPDRIALDPGIGFGKTLEHNLALIRDVAAFGELGFAVLLGVSRKRFIGEILGIEDPRDRLMGTAAAVAWSLFAGVQIFRVHDVAEISQTLRICQAIVGTRLAE